MARITKSSLAREFRDLSDKDAARVVEAAQAVRDAFKLRDVEREMAKIDKLIEGFGVEAVIFREGEGLRNFKSDPHDDMLALYVNTGDSYSPTILWDARRDTVTLTSWGDFVERLPRKFTH
jgi:hypothetical protein